MNYVDVDLQCHSTCSDGTLTPAELVHLAAERNIRALAITDHDNIQGIAEAQTTAVLCNVEFVPAIEFSIRQEPQRDFVDLNILGYWIDPEDATLRGTLDQIIQARIDQKVEQIRILQRYGLDVPVDEVLALAKGVPGRPHIAEVVMRRNPGRFADRQQLFDEFLGVGGKAYSARTFAITVEESIQLVRRAGGIAVLAHPGIYEKVRDVDGMIRRLTAMGLQGLEVWYSYDKNRPHYGIDEAQVQALIAHFNILADQLGLLKTGGSDYHGARKADLELGERGLNWEQYQDLKRRLKTKN